MRFTRSHNLNPVNGEAYGVLQVLYVHIYVVQGIYHLETNTCTFVNMW